MTPRERILKSIKRKGEWAACGHYRTPPPCPYKRSDYAQVWQAAFDKYTAIIAQEIKRLEALGSLGGTNK